MNMQDFKSFEGSWDGETMDYPITIDLRQVAAFGESERVEGYTEVKLLGGHNAELKVAYKEFKKIMNVFS
jgi:hypothetical protein